MDRINNYSISLFSNVAKVNLKYLNLHRKENLILDLYLIHDF